MNLKCLKRSFRDSFPTVLQDTKGSIVNHDSFSKVNILRNKYNHLKSRLNIIDLLIFLLFYNNPFSWFFQSMLESPNHLF